MLARRDLVAVSEADPVGPSVVDEPVDLAAGTDAAAGATASRRWRFFGRSRRDRGE
ncbi:hypothetical protein [Jiangella alba]|uniref:hypothetical protein n=1 Tax=Jiangella alba TaxID=561176 RepID=UPI000B1F917B|nr:hypothetical protein [Jiangella alba]